MEARRELIAMEHEDRLSLAMHRRMAHSARLQELQARAKMSDDSTCDPSSPTPVITDSEFEDSTHTDADMDTESDAISVLEVELYRDLDGIFKDENEEVDIESDTTSALEAELDLDLDRIFSIA